MVSIKYLVDLNKVRRYKTMCTSLETSISDLNVVELSIW